MKRQTGIFLRQGGWWDADNYTSRRGTSQERNRQNVRHVALDDLGTAARRCCATGQPRILTHNNSESHVAWRGEKGLRNLAQDNDRQNNSVQHTIHFTCLSNLRSTLAWHEAIPTFEAIAWRYNNVQPA